MTHFRGHAHFAQQLFLHVLHVQVDAAGGFADKFDGAEFQRFKRAGRAFPRFRTDDHDGLGIRGHDLRGGLQTIHVRHVDVHGDDVWLERFGHGDGFTPVFGMAHNLKLVVGVENLLEDFAHEGGIVHDQDAELFVGCGCHRASTPREQPGASPPFL